MEITVNRDRLLARAKASPQLATEHNRSAWLDLYAEGAVVEDPVGTPPSIKGQNPGRYGDDLSRFYEVFIAPSVIEIEGIQDIVCGRQVFRAVTIHTTHIKTGLQMHIPANLVYDLVEEDGQLRIARMRAHWELNRMSRSVMAAGLKGGATIALMNYRMLRVFGPAWLMAYFKSAGEGVRRAGKEAIQELAAAVQGRGKATVFASNAVVELPRQKEISTVQFIEGCTALQPRELIASGWTVSGLADVEWGGRRHVAGLIAEFERGSSEISRLTLAWEH